MKPPEPLFLAFEGVDRVGKATQVRALSAHLRGLGCAVREDASPDYSSDAGILIRGHLRGDWTCAFTPFPTSPSWRTLPDSGNLLVRQALFLFDMARRAPAVRADAGRRWVVADRWWASALAFGEAEGLDRSALLAAASCLPRPDAWILLDADPDALVARRPEARDRNESDVPKLRRARAAYLDLFRPLFGACNPGVVVDADAPPDEVGARILRALRGLLGKRFPLPSDLP